MTVPSSSSSALQITGTHAPLEVIHLPSGVTVADAPTGRDALRVALPPGRYLVRSVAGGHVYAKEVEVRAGETATLADGQLEATGNDQLAMKGAEDASWPPAPAEDAEADEDASEDEPPSPAPKTPAASAAEKAAEKADPNWRFPSCNGTDPEGTVRASIGCAGVVGIRGSVSDVGGSQRPGLEISADAEEYWRRRIFSGVWQYRLALGGGNAGLEGTLMGGAAFGFRIPVGEHQGPVVRAGAEGYIFGNDAFYSSLLELPQVQLGWQWSEGHAVAEVAALSGVVLTGRFRSGDEGAVDLGAGLTYGGHVSIQVPWVRLSALVERLPGATGLGSVDMAMGTLCAVASPVAICGDALIEQTRMTVAGADTFVRAAYGGITLGFTAER